MFEYASFVSRNASYVTANARKQWSVRKSMLAFRALHTECAATGKTTNLHVHHKVPVSVRPDLAGDPSNMIVLHKDAHLVLGHAGDYKSYVTNVADLCERLKVQRTVASE